VRAGPVTLERGGPLSGASALVAETRFEEFVREGSRA